MSGGETCILGLGNSVLHLVPHALKSTGGLEETQPYSCENSWRLGECPARPNTGGKLVVMRSTEGWAKAQKSWLQTSYHLPHQATPTCSLFLLGFPTPPSLLVHRMWQCLPQSSDPSASAS